MRDSRLLIQRLILDIHPVFETFQRNRSRLEIYSVGPNLLGREKTTSSIEPNRVGILLPVVKDRVLFQKRRLKIMKMDNAQKITVIQIYDCIIINHDSHITLYNPSLHNSLLNSYLQYCFGV